MFSFVCFSYYSFPLAVNLYINLLHLPLFNFAYLFFLFFPFLSTYLLFCLHCFIPHLAPYFSFVFQFVLKLVSFLTGKYNFLFTLFARSIYCTFFLLDCFYFPHGCICVYSIILIIICLIL